MTRQAASIADGTSATTLGRPKGGGQERARLVAAVHEWVAETGRPPRATDWDAAAGQPSDAAAVFAQRGRDGKWPSLVEIRAHFDSFGNLLAAAGYSAAHRRAGRHRVEWTRGEILGAIRRWFDLYGTPPTMADWDPYRARVRGEAWRIERYDAGDWPSAKTVRNHFGRLSTAVAAAGLTPRRQGQRRVQEELVLETEVILRIAAVRSAPSGRQPHQRLAQTVRLVAATRSQPESRDLREALVDVAAAALDWAARLHPANSPR